MRMTLNVMNCNDSNDRRFQSNGCHRYNALDVACVLLLVAYFLHFALPSLAGGFNLDEMTNLYNHWYLGMLKSLWADVCFWEGNYRHGLLAGLLTVPYIYGKTMSPDALARLYPYRPVYSWHNFVINNARFVNELLYLYHVFFPKGLLVVFPKAVLVLWAVVFIYAWMRRDCGHRLMACWVIITPLPLAFIPPRGGACLYLPLFRLGNDFWQSRIGLDYDDLEGPILIGQRVAAAASARPDKLSLRMFTTSATALVACVLAIFTQWENQRFGRIAAFLGIGEKTSHVIQAFRSLGLHPAASSRILLKPENRFYQNGYYPAFVAALIWNDHSLSIYVDDQVQAPMLSIGPGDSHRTLTEQQIATMDYIILFDEFRAELSVLQQALLSTTTKNFLGGAKRPAD